MASTRDATPRCAVMRTIALVLTAAAAASLAPAASARPYYPGYYRGPVYVAPYSPRYAYPYPFYGAPFVVAPYYAYPPPLVVERRFIEEVPPPPPRMPAEPQYREGERT